MVSFYLTSDKFTFSSSALGHLKLKFYRYFHVKQFFSMENPPYQNLSVHSVSWVSDRQFLPSGIIRMSNLSFILVSGSIFLPVPQNLA